MGQRKCRRLEIIEHVDFGKSQRLQQFDAVNHPRTIG
jgi:hypothetical protein